MLRLTVLFLAAGLATGTPHQHGTRDITPPKWPSSYKLDAEIHYQLTDVIEPISLWIDDDKRLALLDKYDGTIRQYFFMENGRAFGHMIFPMSSETKLNQLICWLLIVRSKYYNPAGKLPNMTSHPPYEFLGNERLFGKDVQKWSSSYNISGHNTTDYMWVTYEMDAEGRERPVPLRYATKRVALQQPKKTVDYSYIDYRNYEVKKIDPDIFVIKNITCKPPDLADNHTTEEDHFTHFKTEHGKQYSSEEEHGQRMHIFRHNLRNIEAHNRAGRGYKLAVNHLADRTPEELGFRTGLLPSRQTEGGLQFPYEPAEVQRMSAGIPQEWDWRIHGAVTPVKNQLECGSCWAFGTVGAVEGALKIHSGKPVERLSEQALIDCSWGDLDVKFENGNVGCSGGRLDKAFDYVKKHGLPRYADYAGGYLAEESFCLRENVTEVIKITDYVRIPKENEDALRLAVYKHGPVVVAIDVEPDFFFYSEGVYKGKTCQSDPRHLNHAVLVVGYGELDGQKYWLVKNSWGSTWGMNGYVLMAAGRDTCGILQENYYVTM